MDILVGQLVAAQNVMLPHKRRKQTMLTYVGVDSIFRFLVKCPVHSTFRFLFFGQSDQKNEKDQLSFSGKMWIFYKENKQTGQLIFSFLATLTKKTNNGMNRT